MPFFIGVPEISNDKLKLVWDASYDFDAEDISYSVKLARDYALKDVIFQKDDVVLPEITCDKPDDGQYFLYVQAKNKSGATQDAFDYYVTDEGKHYGMKCFYVQGDMVIEDTYEES